MVELEFGGENRSNLGEKFASATLFTIVKNGLA